MDVIPTDLQAAAASARDRLTQTAAETARLGAEPGGRPSMAPAARAAIFADALLGAMRARLEDLKTAAK